jgi:flagellar motor protein MotB
VIAPRAPRPQRRAFEIWQIIYIDLMTNIMIFFVVLWAIQSHPKKAGGGGISDTIGTETVKMVNLPGDVLFAPGKSELQGDGQRVLQRLFDDENHLVLNFDAGALAKRVLVIHGHTDADGIKDENLQLGYARALAAYRDIKKYGAELADHVVLCTHADNTPAQEVPAFAGSLTPVEQQAVREAKAKNRRITIEDKVISRAREKR